MIKPKYRLSEEQMKREVTVTWTLKECTSIAAIQLAAGMLGMGDKESCSAGLKLLQAMVESEPELKAAYEDLKSKGEDWPETVEEESHA